MSYLLTQMFLYMLVTFLLGLFLGWLFWRYGKPTQASFDALQTERNALVKERDDLQVNLDACRTRSTEERMAVEALRADKIDLQGRIDRMDVDRIAVPTDPVSAAIPAAVAAPIAAEAAPAMSESRPEGLSAARGGVPDDLKEISGIGPALETMLHGLGYYHFDQVASWTEAEEAWIDDNLEGFKGRVSRDNWIEQAKALARR